MTSDERETTLLNADSPEFWCQNSLLKLQSLLCSTTLCSSAAPLEEGNSGSPHNIVKSFLDIKPDTVGALSLRYTTFLHINLLTRKVRESFSPHAKLSFCLQSVLFLKGALQSNGGRPGGKHPLIGGQLPCRSPTLRQGNTDLRSLSLEDIT